MSRGVGGGAKVWQIDRLPYLIATKQAFARSLIHSFIDSFVRSFMRNVHRGEKRWRSGRGRSEICTIG